MGAAASLEERVAYQDSLPLEDSNPGGFFKDGPRFSDPKGGYHRHPRQSNIVVNRRLLIDTIDAGHCAREFLDYNMCYQERYDNIQCGRSIRGLKACIEKYLGHAIELEGSEPYSVDMEKFLDPVVSGEADLDLSYMPEPNNVRRPAYFSKWSLYDLLNP
mmetsp:Transcript_5022/g.5469  ORF Transcript_5022/g.5469 Transcript_5022/m.5469 type:complete len:160 (-) Transcript_5022:135-614(-)